MTNPIPFNKPFIVGKELHNISEAVISNSKLSGNGLFTKKCHKWIEEQFNIAQTFLTHSCTAALEMAGILCDINPGDEVIMPSYTFVSTANAFVLRGAVPVFVDIRQDNLNINEHLIENAITKKTKAIVPVHYAGIPCEMDTILDLAEHYNLFVIEDAAQGFSSKYKNQYLGSIGDMGCLSFHETKNIISGEGGALLINNKKLIERAEIIWEKGTNRKQFLQGSVDKYTWVDIGSSFLPNEQTAAFLYAQLEESEKIINNRIDTFKKYLIKLNKLKNIITFPEISSKNALNGHIFYIITRTQEERKDLINHMHKNDIHAIFHYIPLHNSPAGIKYGRISGDMTVTDDLSSRILRLPLYYGMTGDEIEKVVETLINYYQ